MKTKLFLLISLFSLSTIFAQLSFNFEDQDLSQWQQHPENKWTIQSSGISGYSLKHNYTSTLPSTQDAISTPIIGLYPNQTDITWKFMIRHQYAPSEQNYWLVYLGVDGNANDMLTDNNVLNGYAIGINANSGDDRLTLYKVTNGAVTTILRTTYDWQTKVGTTTTSTGTVEVKRSQAGQWSIRAGTPTLGSSLGSVMDTEHTNFTNTGIRYTYSAGASKKLVFDNYNITYTQASPPNDSDSEILSSSSSPPDFSIPTSTLTASQAQPFLTLNFLDKGTNDTKPTNIQSILLHKTVASVPLNSILGGITAFVNETPIPISYTIYTDSVRLHFTTAYALPSGSQQEIDFHLWLKPAAITDHSTLQFKVDKNQHGAKAKADGSQFVANLSEEIVSASIDIDVRASQISMDSCATLISKDTDFGLRGSAKDQQNNIDVDYNLQAEVSLAEGLGVLNSSSSLSKNLVSGRVEWTDLRYNQQDPFKVQISGGDLRRDTSDLINVAFVLDEDSEVKASTYPVLGHEISSLKVEATDEVEVFRFMVNDRGTSDQRPTLLKEIRFDTPTACDWTQTLAQVHLYHNDVKLPTHLPVLTRQSIQLLLENNFIIPDGDSTEISVRIILQKKVKDGDTLQLRIPILHLFQTAPTGSGIQGTLNDVITSDKFLLNVETSQLIISRQVLQTRVGEVFDLEIKATDIWGAVDSSNHETVDLTAIGGTLSSPEGLSKTMTKGVVKWEQLSINENTVFQIKAQQNELEVLTQAIAAVDRNSTVLVPLSQIPSGSFSSSDTSALFARSVMKLVVKDQGTYDSLGTALACIRLQNSNSAVSDLSEIIGGVVLKQGNAVIAANSQIDAQSISIYPEDFVIPDGTQTELTVAMYLKPGHDREGTVLQFVVPKIAHGWSVKSNSSQLLDEFPQAIRSNPLTIESQNDQLIVLHQDFLTATNGRFKVEVGVGDPSFVLNTAFEGSIEATLSEGNGTLTGQTQINIVNGKVSFDLQYTGLGTFTLQLSTAGLSKINSYAITSSTDITLLKEDRFESNASSANGSLADWKFENKTLRHQSGSGRSIVAYTIQADLKKRHSEWRFSLENGNFDPSADNAFWWVLASEDPDLEQSGYMIGVNYTGNWDLISFWRRDTAGTKKLIWESNFNWDAKQKVDFVVSRTENGVWTVALKLPNKELRSFPSFVDNTFDKIAYTGLVFKYTPTRRGLLWLDNFQFVQANTPPRIQSVRFLASDSLLIAFDEGMQQSSVLSNFELRSTKDNTLIDLHQIVWKSDSLAVLSTAIMQDSSYHLSVKGFSDIDLWPILDTTVFVSRMASHYTFGVKVINRKTLILTPSTPFHSSIEAEADKMHIINQSGKRLNVGQIEKQGTAIRITCDGLEGRSYTLYLNEVSMSDGFKTTDSVRFDSVFLPAKALKVEVLSPKSLKLTFDKTLKTTVLDNYQLRNAQQVQIPIESVSLSDKSVNLSLSSPLQGSQFTLTYQGIVDSEDFVLHDSIRFSHQRLKFSDLVFSEVMYKPSPAVGLPGVEYLELYNRTSDTIDLAGLRIVTDKGVASKINACKLPPHNFVTISSSSSSSKLSEFGRACSATNFPSLLDVGMSLRLMDDSTDLAIVNYLPSWHSNTDKAKGGWSLERTDINNLSDDQNWKSSEDVRGGTPGQANSVAGDNPDTKKPQVSSWRINEVGNIVLSFDEWMLSDSLQVKNNFGGIDIANVLNVGAFTSLSVELQPTTALIPNQIYNLQIHNLVDLSGNVIVDTTVSVFRTGPQVQSYKVHSADSLQITFDRSMKITNLSNVANYQLKTSADIDIAIQNIVPDQFGRNVHFKTARFTDTLLYLSISGMTDLDNLPSIDTTIAIRRTPPHAKGALNSPSRSELVLELDQSIPQNAILDPANFRLISDGKVVKIYSVVSDNLSRAVLTRLKFVTDPLQGKKITLHWKQLEISSGFLISDSLDLSHSYLPAKAIKTEVLSPKSLKLTFDKVIKASVLEDYQLRNAQQVEIPIESASYSDKSVNLSLSNPLQGSQFVLTYQGIVDKEDFVLHDSIRFTDQRLKFSDLVFSEVMYKPSPVVGLPAVEYLELYNRTSDTIDLADLRIVTDKGVVSKINACKLPPYNYVTVSSSSSSNKLSEFGRACSATNFPSLLDVGMSLRLMDDSTDLAIVNYLPSWHSNTDKAKGGWSLERIDINNLSDDQNWKSSEDVRGGTPGQANSVAANNPDTKKPQVSSWRINEVGNIVLNFDEWMLGDSLQIKNNFGGIDIANVLNVGAFTSLSVELQPTIALIPNQIYNLQISNLVDLSGNIIVDTLMSVFRTGPEVQSYKVHSADSLQITFDRSMRITDLSIVANYQLKTSAGTDIAIQTIVPDQFGRNVHFKTARFTDTLLYLSISGMTDLTDLSLSDTIVSIHRTPPKIKATLKSLSRSELSLEFDQLLSQNAILDTANFRLISDGKAVTIHSVISDNLSRAVFTRLKLVTDPLQGKKITLHWKQLEINSGFLISDSLDLSHSYLPAKALKAEVLSPKSIKLTFDKTLKTTVLDNYQLRNAQQVQIPIESVSLSDKSVNLSLSNPLQGSQFVLTYQGIVDKEDFVLHDSIRFTDQRLKFSDLVFSEVMYKPSPVVGLPAVEYLELYNRTSDTIDLAGLRIVTDKGVASKINACKLPPYNYASVSSSSSSSKLSEFGGACSATNFPSLLDVGMSLRLMDDSTDLAIVNYLPTWQTNSDKAKGGWSLERIDINNLSDDQNWKSSEDVRGGTPGQANSVAGNNPDTKKPQVSVWRINEVGNIVLVFDEWMLSDSLQIKNNFGGIDIANVLNVGAFTSLSVELQPTIALIPNQICNLQIHNLVDLSGNIIVDTLVSVFRTGPQVQSYKVHSADSLQITFDRSMRITDLSIAANYQLKTSAGKDVAIQAIVPDQFGRNVYFKTARFTDTLLYLSISGMTDLDHLPLIDTTVAIRRTPPQAESALKSASRSELVLELDQSIPQNAILDTANFRLTSDGKVVKIHSVASDNLSRTVLTRLKFITDPLQGKKITLHWKQLEINSGFLISDSLDLAHSYLPAKALNAEVLSPKSLKLTFDKTLKTTVLDNYQLRNAQQVEIPIESVSLSDKSVNLSLSSPLQGSQFTLTYQGIVDSEDFVLHDSIRFTDQRLKFSDLVFSEVMYKPSPVVGLPAVEYLELYNRTSDTIDLAGLRIVTDKGVVSKINACKLPPHNFVTISSSSSLNKLSEFGLACSATNFPSLLDVGMSLRLMDDSTDLAIVNYQPSWQTNSDKAKGGWSLERIDVNNLSDDQNWKSSEDVRGGTPGQANSVAGDNPDTKKPQVSSWRINEVGNIVLSFDEWMLSDSLQIKNNFGGIDIANVFIPSAFASLSVEIQSINALIPNQIYNLQIRNLVDLSGNVIVDTLVSVFRTGPQVQSYKVHSADSLQITFDRSMRMADLSIVANYQLKTFAGTDIAIQAIVPDQFGRNVHFKTARFTDTLLYLSISGMTDLTDLSLSDTIVSIHRTPPKIKATLKSLSRSELVLELDQSIPQNTILDTANFRLTTDTQLVSIHSVVSDNLSRAVLTRLKLVTDPLQGKKITLHWKQLEISSGFLISDSLDLSHSYLPAKALKAEVLSPKFIKLTFDKTLKTTVLDNYQLRNAQQVQIPIANINHSDKSVSLSLASPLQGSQFTLTYQEIVDSEDFVLHDSIKFSHQRLKFSDLVFSEVMYKPSPTIGLPGVEYLELYNRTSDTIDLADLHIVTDKGVVSKINACKLPPYNYVTFSSSSSSSKLSEFGGACSATNFPSLLDVGMSLRLMDDSTDLAIVNYLPSWQTNSDKAKGGWSLERIDINNLSDDQNWKSSEDVRGGTPGQANSVAANNPDTKKPQVSSWRINEVGNIILSFDEWMLGDSLQVKNNFGGIDIANMVIPSAFASLSVELQPTTVLIPNQIYNLQIRNLVDLSGNIIVDTLVSVFRTGPQVQSYKVHSADSLQITFDRSMRITDLSIATNYQLKTSAGKDLAIQAIVLDQFGQNVYFKTARFTDTLLYLSISQMTDLTGLSLNDTIVSIHRTPPKIKATLKSLSRSELSLEFDQLLSQKFVPDTTNFRLISDGKAVKVHSVVSDNLSRAVLTRLKLATDSIQGKKITLHWNQLEISSGFLISDSLDLSHSYLPAKALKVEVLSPKSLKLTFDKTLKTTILDNYQLRNAQQVEIPIESVSLLDKSVNLSLASPLQGSQFVLTYQGIVDSEDFVLHDSIKFSHQRLKFLDLVFSEVMYKPSPVVGLPAVEYLELYNRTSDTIDLAGLRIVTDKGVASKISACKLPPYNYASVSSSSSSSKLSEYGLACSATNFPSLLDVGMSLRLMADSTDLAIVNYQPSWQTNSDKAKGGWSLERIDVNNLSDDQNWKSSEDVRGGTPGQANSVAANNPDTKKPQVSSWRINEVGNIVLSFDEWMLSDSLQIKNNFGGIDIANVLSTAAFASLSVELQPATALIPNQIYNLQISNLVDLSGNVIVDTIVSVFRTGPQVQSYKVHSPDSLQIIFDRSMRMADLSIVANYQLKTSAGTDITIQNIVPDQFGRNVYFKTARFTDTLLYLSISGMTDLTDLSLNDTIVSIHRTPPKIKATLKSTSRSELVLELDQSIPQNAILDTANFRLTTDTQAVTIHSVVSDNLSRTVLTRLKFVTDSLQGKKITLHWKQLEINSGFLISDSLDLSHSYLPAKVIKTDVLSTKSIKLTFDKVIKASVLEDYQLRNAQQVQIPIASISHSDKSVNLSLSSPLQGSQFVLTYQGIVDNEDFVLHDSIRFSHQRLKFSDLVFSEVMYKPSPVVGLPGVEYLELYNRTSDTIDLADLHIVTDKGVVSKINACKLPPYNYVTFSSSSSSSKLSEFGGACSATNFPSLLDVGMSLRLMDDSTDLAIVNYLPMWHSNSDKAKGGWSLERIDINNLSDDQNWKSSEDVRGGTPGQANSVAANNPDTKKPQVSSWRINEVGNIVLSFDEWMLGDSLQVKNNFGGIDIANMFIPSAFASLSVEIQPTNALIPNQIYNLHIRNLVDLSGNIIVDTLMSVFRTGPEVQSYKVHSADSLQITFDRSMRMADLSIVANYQLKTSAGKDITIQNIVPDQFGRNVHFKTTRFTDTLLYLSISQMTDLTGLSLSDTIVSIHRTPPKIKATLKSTSRSELVLELDQSIPQNTILDTANFRLTTDTQAVTIHSVISDNLSRAVLTRLKLVTDPLQGKKITLHWKQLEISSGFLISDSLDLSHSYLPAKVIKTEVLSPKSLKLTFDKALKTTILDNYQLRNAQQVEIPIESVSLLDKSVNLSLASPLQGSQFVLTYQGIVDSEDFVLHDSIKFSHQRLKFSDLVFSEVMYKPSPVVGLPAVEYLELYNRTSDTIDLAGLRIVTDEGVASKISACKLPPYNYASVSSSSSSSKLSEYGLACSATNFPSLLDVGMSLRLMDDSTDLAIVNYLPSWHSNTDKAKGGWSLERIDINNLSDDQNWKSSEDVRGGTPGQANSVAANNPDTKKPQVSSWRINEVGNIVLSFDEWMLSDSLQVKNNFGGIDIANVLSTAAFASLSVELQPATALIPNQIYNLQISNLVDLSGNVIVDTIVSVFRTGPQVQSYKVHSPDSLQITFDRSMRITDLSIATNYQLKTSAGKDLAIQAIVFDQFRQNVYFKTARFTDTLLYLSISGMTDLDHLPLIDTTVAIHRTSPQAKGALKSASRSELVLELDQSIPQNAILDTANFRLTRDGKVVKIYSVVSDNLSRAVLTRLKFVTDPLQGKKITLHWKQLEISSGFLISDSLDLAHSYLPAKALKAEVLSPKSLKLTFDKTLKTTVRDNYQLRNAQQVQIPIESVSLSDKSVNLSLANPLQGSQFVLTYQGIVDSEDFVLHDSIRFSHQRLKFSDLVFSEVMYKPSPVVGLPAVEYLELYNRTSDTIDLAGLRIVTDKGVASKINACKLPPHNFVTISSSSSLSKLSEFGLACSATNFPSLLDVGMSLRLMADSTDLAIVNYQPSWQTNSDKAKGGWSLERIDVNNLSDDQNWKSSEDVRGGTPGQANSVAGENPDTQKPFLLNWLINEDGSLLLTFNEVLELESAQNMSNYNLNGAQALSLYLTENAVLAHFDHSFVVGETAVLTISGVTDLSDNECEWIEINIGLFEDIKEHEVLINEVLFYPNTGGNDFVEVYNNSQKPIDLMQLKLASRNKKDGSVQQISSITQPYVLLPQAYAVLSKDVGNLSQFYQTDDVTLVNMKSFPSYSNDEGSVVLLNSSDLMIDEFNYHKNMHFKLLRTQQGVSLERINFDLPTNAESRWHSAAASVGFATPGYKNSQFSEFKLSETGAFTIQPSIFSPDSDGFDDILYIDYQLSDPGYLANIIIFDIQGRKVKELAKQFSLNTEGRLSWDGLTDQNILAGVGLYVIYFELFDLQGNVKSYKKTVVLTVR